MKSPCKETDNGKLHSGDESRVGWAQSAPDPLKKGFENPPESARPRVWWHWMNGNISKEGIKLDLEWMRRVGLGGFQNFDAALQTPQVVDKRLPYMTLNGRTHSSMRPPSPIS